ncbi:PKD domain-containing protein [Kutzneria chonburiensis]|uniref:PKD domain-containing protein n=1 Tax=Kutzneria chonburiensis TaxID=1483604 RepID=A0ABV6N787_9PSEU|nr:hypothetical protein [Kutzneria chonburiensis]
MTLSIRRMSASVVGLVAVATVLFPGIANAAPPSNDDIDTATAITALPFAATQDTTQATKATDDPTSCYAYGQRSTWYDYTAPADGVVLATVSATGSTPVLAAYTGARDALTQVTDSCTSYNHPPSSTFHVTAGTTYHLLVLDLYAGSQVTFRLNLVPASPNDNFAAAIVPAFPGDLTGDLARASAEPGETPPSCDATVDHSVWYRYTPERTRSVSVEQVSYFDAPSISVYQGTSVDRLTEVDCVRSQDRLNSVFTAVAGQTYYIRVAAGADHARSFDLSIATAPALAPGFSANPERPSVFSDIQFYTYPGDPLGRKFASGQISFGDGTSAPLTGDPIHHQYTKDGQYQVTVSGATNDGRTGSTVRTLKVETHDVSVANLVVPASARAGQTKSIKVSVVDTRYDEDVTVTLSRLYENGVYNSIGSLTQRVAAGHTVEFPFAYTYTAADVAAGKVTFQVSAGLPNHYPADDHPDDNQLVGVTTSVRS